MFQTTIYTYIYLIFYVWKQLLSDIYNQEGIWSNSSIYGSQVLSVYMYRLVENHKEYSLCLLLKLTVYIKCYFHFQSYLSKLPYSNEISVEIIDVIEMFTEWLHKDITEPWVYN